MSIVVYASGTTYKGPAIDGGTIAAVTSLGLRSSGTGAFDMRIANAENLTAARTLTAKLNNADRSLELAGNVVFAGAFSTVGAYAMTLTATAATNVTLPTTGTLATLGALDAYAYLAGRSGGQTLIGDTASGGSLTLQSTAHSTRGPIYLGGAHTSAWDEANSRLGVLTVSPTHSMTLGSTATGIALYNTVDQVTDYERFTIAVVSNRLLIQAEKGGAGTARTIKIASGDGTGIIVSTVASLAFSGTNLGYYNLGMAADGPGLQIEPRLTTTAGNACLSITNDQVGAGTGMSASSGLQYIVAASAAVNQSGTAGYTALLVNVTEGSTGSGTKLLLDLQRGASSMFSVDRVGAVTATSFIGPLTGNATTATLAASATKLATARAINGVDFDGTAAITITASTTAALSLGTHLSYASGSTFDGSAARTIGTDATNANTASTIVARDGSGNFVASTITAALSGNATTATTLATSRNLWGQAFTGGGDVTGSLSSVADITGGASSMTVTAGTGASRTLTFKTTTAGSTATTALTLAADQSATFANTVNATTFVGALTGHASSDLPLTGGTLTGALLFTDNTYDIGASLATRPRTGYFGTSLVAPTHSFGASSAQLTATTSFSTAQLVVNNSSGTNVDGTGIRIGTADSNGLMIYWKSAARLRVTNGDASAYASLDCLNLQVANTATITWENRAKLSSPSTTMVNVLDSTGNAYANLELLQAFPTTGVATASGAYYAWTSSSSDPTGTVDTRLARVSAGKVGIQDGSGNDRDLQARAVNISGSYGQTQVTTNTPTGTTQTIDWSLGNFQILTLASASGGVTVTHSNMVQGGSYVLKIIQHASAAKTVTFSSTKYPAGTAPTATTTLSGVDFISFLYDGTNTYGLPAMGATNGTFS